MIIEVEKHAGIRSLHALFQQIPDVTEFMANIVLNLGPVLNTTIVAPPSKQGLLNPLHSQDFAVLPFPTEVLVTLLFSSVLY
jgi:hypothetical protein